MSGDDNKTGSNCVVIIDPMTWSQTADVVHRLNDRLDLFCRQVASAAGEPLHVIRDKIRSAVRCAPLEDVICMLDEAERPLRLPQIPSPAIVFTCNASATEAAAYGLMADPTHNGGRLCKGCKKNVYFGKGKVCSSCRAPKPNYKKKGFVRGRGSGVRT